MKVAVIGVGNVGKTIFHDLQHVNMISEITLVDRNLDRARAEVMDARDAAVLKGKARPHGNAEGQFRYSRRCVHRGNEV